MRKAFSFFSSSFNSLRPNNTNSSSQSSWAITTWIPPEEEIKFFYDEKEKALQKNTTKTHHEHFDSNISPMHEVEQEHKSKAGFLEQQIKFLTGAVNLTQDMSSTSLQEEYFRDLEKIAEDLVADYQENLKSRINPEAKNRKEKLKEELEKFKNDLDIEMDMYIKWGKQLPDRETWSLLLDGRKEKYDALIKRSFHISNIKKEKGENWCNANEKIAKELVKLKMEKQQKLDEANLSYITNYFKKAESNKKIDLRQADGQNSYIFEHACQEGYAATLKYILEKDITFIRCNNKDGNTILHLLIKFGHFNLLKDITSFLEKDTSLSIKNIMNTCNGINHRNLLHTAAYYGKTEIAKWLITKFSFNPNEKDILGNTALHLGALGNNADFIKTIFPKKENNNENDSPLALSLKEKKPEAVKSFISEGIFLSDVEADKLLSYAEKNRDVELLGFMSEAVSIKWIPRLLKTLDSLRECQKYKEIKEAILIEFSTTQNVENKINPNMKNI